MCTGKLFPETWPMCTQQPLVWHVLVDVLVVAARHPLACHGRCSPHTSRVEDGCVDANQVAFRVKQRAA